MRSQSTYLHGLLIAFFKCFFVLLLYLIQQVRRVLRVPLYTADKALPQTLNIHFSEVLVNSIPILNLFDIQ